MCYTAGMATRVTVNISLPPALKAWVEQQVERRGYGTTSEYFRDLVRIDQGRLSAVVASRPGLEAKLLESIEGPPARAMSKARWRSLRGRVRADAAKRSPVRRKSA